MTTSRRLLATLLTLPLLGAVAWAAPAGATPGAADSGAGAVATHSAPALAGASVAGKTLFGVSLSRQGSETRAETVARNVRTFGSLPVVRIYDGKPPTTWAANSSLSTLPAGTSVIYTFSVPDMTAAANGAYDANVASMLASRPAGSIVWMGLQHEPEGHVAAGEFTAAQYRAATSHVAKVIKAYGGIPTTVLTGSTAYAARGQGYLDYYSPDIDVLAWDAYNSGQRKPGTTYRDASRFLTPVLRIAAETGKQYGWAEFGAPCIVTDPSCAERSRWLPVLGQGLADGGAQFVSYWNHLSLNGTTDYSLLDAASVAAWKGLIAR